MESEIISEAIKGIPVGTEVNCQFTEMGSSSARSVVVSRRELHPELPRSLPERPISRHPARCHVFEDVEAFCEYLKRWASAEYGLVLFDGEKFVAVLDESQETDRETVYCKAPKSAIAEIRKETGLLVGKGVIAHRPWVCLPREVDTQRSERVELQIEGGHIEVMDG